MKFLQKHGKKVSICLLALAIMVTPMLQAAASDTCPKKQKILLFSDAENMVELWFDNDVDSSNDYGDFGVANGTGNDSGYIEVNNGEILYQGDTTETRTLGAAMIQAPYSLDAGDTITVHCPEDTSSGLCSYITLASGETSKEYTQATKEDFMKEVYRPNAVLWFTDQLLEIYGWSSTFKENLVRAGYQSDRILLAEGSNTDDAAATGFSLKSDTYFGNTIPADAEIIEKKFEKNWSDADIDGDIQLELINDTITSCSNLKEYAASDTVSYVMHTDWQNFGSGSNQGTCLTVEHSNVNYHLTSGAANTSAYKNMFKNTLLQGAPQSIPNNNVFETNYNSVPSWYIVIERSSVKAANTTNSGFTKSLASVNDVEATSWHQMPYQNKKDFWIYIPAKLTITYQENCAVDTAAGSDTSKTTNPETGIVSYAVIGTLLVGAASAYIYARKSNKFNKL